MSIIVSMRQQKAVYWPLGSDDTSNNDFDEYGNPQYGSPVEIDCRWESVNELFISPKGEQLTSRAIVYTDRDTPAGGVLFLGTLADVTDLSNPKNNTGAWEIRRFDKLPNLKNTEELKTAYL